MRTRRFALVAGVRLLSFAAELLTVESLACYLGVEPTTIYTLTRKRSRTSGQPALPSIRIGKELRFKRSSVEAWLEAKERA